MFRSVSAAAAAVMLAGVTACGVPAMTASPDREAEARALLEDLVNDRDDALIAKMSSQVKPADVRAQLPFMKTMAPEGPVPQGQVTGWRANTGTGGTIYEVNQTYDYPDRVLVVNTVFRKEGETWKVLGFHIAPTMKAGAAGEKMIPVEAAP